MKKFQFSLNKMLDYKDQLLEKEKGTLSQYRAQKNKIDDDILALEQEFEHFDQLMKEESRQGTSITRIRSFNFMMGNIRQQIKQLHVQQKVYEAAIENQVKVVVAASQEVSGLDKLKEKQMDEYKHMVAKNDELMISEFISSKLIRERGSEAANLS